MKLLSDLSDNQRKFIRENAERLFEVTLLPPSDDIPALKESTCRCCEGRRKFLEELEAAR